jgi:hypothetical protein
MEYRRYSDCLKAREVLGSNPPIPVAERCKARVCGRLLAGVTGLNPTGGMDVCVVSCRGISDMRTDGIREKNG